MHTATRLSLQLLDPLRRMNPSAHFCCYGLYAPMTAEYLRALGVKTSRRRIRTGACGSGGAPFRDLSAASAASAARFQRLAGAIAFQAPDRDGPAATSHVRASRFARRRAPRRRLHGSQPRLQASLPALPDRAGLQRRLSNCRSRSRAGRHPPAGGRRRAAHHLRRSRFFQRYGPRDSSSWKRCIANFPQLTYDVTIKVEHLLKHADLLPTLRDNRMPVHCFARWNRWMMPCCKSSRRRPHARGFLSRRRTNFGALA